MKLDTFINRPVLSTVISIFIVLLGLIGLFSLPVTQFPDIAPPTIRVSTTYTGANAQAVLNSVIAPLEESINGAEGMTYMESTATNTGSADITVYFEQGFDPDMAAVDVQNRVAKAQNLLPAEVTQVGVLTQKRQSSMLLMVALYDPTGRYSMEFIDNYAKINMIPQLQRVSGVGRHVVRRRLLDANLAEARCNGPVRTHAFRHILRPFRTEYRGRPRCVRRAG